MIKTWELTIEQLSPELTRTAYLYLPEQYDEDPDARFPVLYLFDGQNVFFDEDASFGRSWRLADFLQQTTPPLIVAAISSNPIGDNRLIEYSPFSHQTSSLGPINARGRTTMRWLIDEFKPQIDDMARTLPDRENTFIGGSSMGGLMSLYAVLDYNDVFSRAISLSPSLWVDPAKVRRMIKAANVAPDSWVFIDYGGQEISNHYQNEDALFNACQLLFNKKIDLTFRIAPDGTHSEESWEQRFPIALACLGLSPVF